MPVPIAAIHPKNFGSALPLIDQIRLAAPSDLIAFYPMDDPTAARARNLSTLSKNVLYNGSFDLLFAGGNYPYNSVFDAWGKEFGNPALETVNVHTPGGSAVKLGRTNYDYLISYPATPSSASISLPAGNYILECWTCADANGAPARVGIHDDTRSEYLIAENTSLGITGTDYAKVQIPFTVVGVLDDLTLRIRCPENPVGAYAFVDDVSIYATSPTADVYKGTPTSITAGQTMLDGQPSYHFENGSFVDLLNTAAPQLLNWNEGSVLLYYLYKNPAAYAPGEGTAKNQLNIWTLGGNGNHIHFEKDVEGPPPPQSDFVSYPGQTGISGNEMHQTADLLWHSHLVTWKVGGLLRSWIDRVEGGVDGYNDIAHMPVPIDGTPSIYTPSRFRIGDVTSGWIGDLARFAVWNKAHPEFGSRF